MNLKRGFIKERKRFTWDESKWDDGYIVDKRFRVYRPDYPKATPNGYALRSHIVWWLHNKTIVDFQHPIHHIDGNFLNDKIENLKQITKKEHDKIHSENNKTGLDIFCARCGKEIYRRLSDLMRRKTIFCSRHCKTKGVYIWQI